MMQKQIRDIQINILEWLKAYSNDQYLSPKIVKKSITSFIVRKENNP